MTKRAAIYARYSSDLQSDASIEDQVRLAERLIADRGWELTQTYTDHGMSGASLIRPGYQKLLEDARSGAFEAVVAESIDRLSRDQEHIAAFHKAMLFADITICTSSEGDINELHIGLKGTMSALYLKDLADKTRRGLEGRVRKGKSGGGISYGYNVVDLRAADGSPVRGDRSINQSEAAIIRQIFREYSHGESPRSIAHNLNRTGVRGPSGGTWSPSTISGNWRRGTGILNNELYVGRLVWNRQRFIKDPINGKRQARLNPEEKWVIEDVPLLRIVDEGLWITAKKRQLDIRKSIVHSGGRSEIARRPRYLLSGLLECGTCGGGFSKINKDLYGCSTARNKAICSNRLSIRRDKVEHAVLGGLKDKLMQPEAYQAFVAEFTKEFNARSSQEEATKKRCLTELEKINSDIRRVIDAIKAGVSGEILKDEIATLETKRANLESQLRVSPPTRPLLHPNLSKVYQKKITNIIEALNTPDTISEANKAIRQLIQSVRLVPKEGSLQIELYGELAALLELSEKPKTKHPLAETEGVQVTMVAGAGFEPTTFGL